MTETSINTGAVVLLTGGAGFLGKVVLEHLLRQKKDLGISKVILVIRPNRKRSAAERFTDQVATAPCFYRLPLNWTRHVEVISGDLSLPAWGLTPAEQQALAERVTHIIHSAASVDFNLPIKDAAEANITSALSVIDFAKTCPNLASIVSVSTAYVRPHRAGPLAEELVDLPFDPAQMYEDIKHGRCAQADLLATTGHPNTYTLTKCIAEHLILRSRGTLPLSIVRPSIISAALKYPFPGWIDSYAALAAFVGVFGAGYLRIVAADPDARLDVVPVDVVADTIVTQCFRVPANVQNPQIVHAVAGLKNAMLIGQLPQTGGPYFDKFPSKRQVYLWNMGPLNFRRKVEHVMFHRVPTNLAKFYARLTGQDKLAERIGKLNQVLNSIFAIFPYFTHRSFDFVQHKPTSLELNFKSYLFLICEGVHKYLLKGSPDRQLLVGASADKNINLFTGRHNVSGLDAAGAGVRQCIERIFSEVVFDQASFMRALSNCPDGMRLVIASSEHSYFDCILVCYLRYARPDLDIGLTGDANASTFAKLPVIGPLFKAMSVQGEDLSSLLKDRGETFAVLPVAIAYDQIPESMMELKQEDGDGEPMRAYQIAQWLEHLTQRSSKLGSVHIRCGEPVIMRPADEVDARRQRIAAAIKQAMPVSSYHVAAFLEAQARSEAKVGSNLESSLEPAMTAELLTAILRRCGATTEPSLLPEQKNPSLVSSLDLAVERAGRTQWQHFVIDAVSKDVVAGNLVDLDEDELQTIRPLAAAILAPIKKVKLTGASIEEQSAVKSNRHQGQSQGQITAERPTVQTDLV
ncbi:MAG: fatty acyl-CoA reductase [Proteobacteria bacterium]|nr:fatty acyl-CoA reductase [Pseudomonadota bacterium]